MVPDAAPLRHDQVRHLADCAGQVIMPAMLGAQPEPLAHAAWQAHIALLRIAELLSPDLAAADRDTSADTLAYRGDMIREAAHEALADGQTQLRLTNRRSSPRPDGDTT